MLYRIAHILRDKFPWIWESIGVVNSFLFVLRYGKRMKKIKGILKSFSLFSNQTSEETSKSSLFNIEALTKENVSLLSRMFAEQPASAFDFFKPHGFDELSLNKLAKDKSFLAYIVVAEGTVQQKVCVGYFFQRSFFWGKSFRGYMTDYRWQRRGINKMMNLCATEISSLLGLRVFGTIAPDNIASMKSAQTANDVHIIETLPNGDYYVEYKPKTNYEFL